MVNPKLQQFQRSEANFWKPHSKKILDSWVKGTCNFSSFHVPNGTSSKKCLHRRRQVLQDRKLQEHILRTAWDLWVNVNLGDLFQTK